MRRGWDLGLLTIMIRKLKEQLISFFSILMGVYREMEPDSSSWECTLTGWKTMDTNPNVGNYD